MWEGVDKQPLSTEFATIVPDPDVLVVQIMDDLEAALEQFRTIAEDLGEG